MLTMPLAFPLMAAIDAVFDSVSVVTTFKEELAKAGVIFCSISEAIREHPDFVRKYLGSVVPQSDNFYAALNSAVFSDGSFVYVPEGCIEADQPIDIRWIHTGEKSEVKRVAGVVEFALPQKLEGVIEASNPHGSNFVRWTFTRSLSFSR